MASLTSPVEKNNLHLYRRKAKKDDDDENMAKQEVTKKEESDDDDDASDVGGTNGASAVGEEADVRDVIYKLEFLAWPPKNKVS